ncbi:MAG: DUF2079 domain-containing protein [Bacteroidia bacterium]|nr:DUF2079 domain-containing protein [Bacteroidia bacterium]MDW8134474.1 DUF2079 domain-containing protein [Bacteroidia bacterium]
MSRWGWGLLIGFGVLFCLVSLPNHYNFRTYGDTAYYLQMCEFYLKGRLFYGHLTTMTPFADKGINPPTLYVNWSVILAVPFYLLGKSWGLLIFQILCFLVGGVGIYKVVSEWLTSSQATWTLLHYFGMWGLWSAAAFEFHEVAIGVAALPWSLYFFQRGRDLLSLILWMITVGCKEVFSIWGVFLWTGWAWLWRKVPSLRDSALKIAGISFLYAFLLIGVILPLAEKNFKTISRTSFYYAYLAEKHPTEALRRQLQEGWQGMAPPHKPREILLRVLQRPQLIWSLLFESPDVTYFGVKSELHWAVLWSGGWSFYAAPAFLWILLPIYLYKLLAANYFMWGTLHHYGLEFALILPLSVAWVARKSNRSRWLLPAGAILSCIMGLSLLGHRYSKWYEPERHRWYHSKHYCSEYSYARIHEGLQQIPPKASVSAVACLLTHIPMRDKLYHFPAIQDAEYLALLEGSAPCCWPMKKEAYYRFLDSLDTSKEWQKIWHRNLLRIYRRASSSGKTHSYYQGAFTSTLSNTACQ